MFAELFKFSSSFGFSHIRISYFNLLYILLLGNSGEAYNVADLSCDITLRELASKIAGICGTKVVFELPSELEAAGFSKATKARLDSTKLHALGWKPLFSLDTALEHTIAALR